MFVGCVIVTAVYIEKEPETMDASELAPFFSGFFFGVLHTLAELRSADCRCGTERVWMSPFFLRKKRAGSRCGAEWGNANCGALHLIRFAALSTFPLRGSSAEGGDEV